jgi:hypothetical protein
MDPYNSTPTNPDPWKQVRPVKDRTVIRTALVRVIRERALVRGVPLSLMEVAVLRPSRWSVL